MKIHVLIILDNVTQRTLRNQLHMPRFHLSDFTSAFNLQPHIFANKHIDDFNVRNQLVAMSPTVFL